jgi:hypothetical protein
MQPTGYLEHLLRGVDAQLMDIILELRNIIAAIAPQATEVIHRSWLTYYDEKRGGPVSAGICQIGIQKDHVRLAFIHGAFLHDPRGLLEGDRKAKRFVRISSYESAPWEDIQDLIVASYQFDPRSLTINAQ